MCCLFWVFSSCRCPKAVFTWRSSVTSRKAYIIQHSLISFRLLQYFCSIFQFKCPAYFYGGLDLIRVHYNWILVIPVKTFCSYFGGKLVPMKYATLLTWIGTLVWVLAECLWMVDWLLFKLIEVNQSSR